MPRIVVSLILCFALLAMPRPAIAGTWDLGSAWEKARASYKGAAETAKNARDKTAEVSEKAFDATAEWCGDHKEEIAAVVIITTAAVVSAALGQDAPPQQTQPRYTGVKNPPTVGAGKPFTAAHKSQILDANRARNKGVLRSDLSGQILQPATKHVKGATPPSNEAHVDHIIPKWLGGTNSSSNAQVLSRSENLSKGATVIIPKWLGGTNGYFNAQVLPHPENLSKATTAIIPKSLSGTNGYFNAQAPARPESLSKGATAGTSP